MNKKILWSVIIVVVLGAAGAGIAWFALKTNAQSQSPTVTMAQVNQDLIQSKVDLEGWQEEDARGNLALADYRSAFAANLRSMYNKFGIDYQALTK